MQSYLERDLRALSAVHDLGSFERFMRLAASRSGQLLATHYARGAFFEAAVVSEAIKWRSVRGHGQPLYFWRDNIGNEVDLLLEEGAAHTLVEVKSGQTFQAEWLRDLATVDRHLGGATRRALVYGGDSSHEREGVRVIGRRDLVDAG